MQIKNQYVFYSPVLLIIILTALTQIGCNQKPKSGNEKQKNQIEDKNIETTNDGDYTFLFDGKTLTGWEITNFGTEGPVNISENSIILGMGDGCTGVTWTGDFPKMNYEVSLEAKKISGNDFFCGMTFPYKDTYCSLIVGGWGGPVVGLSIIDGLDASENETRTLKKFEHDKWYKIRLRVTEQKIEAWIDNEEVVNFNTPERDLNIRPEVNLSRPFGICSWITTAALRNIKLKRT
jgi:hypothetical protein